MFKVGSVIFIIFSLPISTIFKRFSGFLFKTAEPDQKSKIHNPPLFKCFDIVLKAKIMS